MSFAGRLIVPRPFGRTIVTTLRLGFAGQSHIENASDAWPKLVLRPYCSCGSGGWADMSAGVGGEGPHGVVMFIGLRGRVRPELVLTRSWGVPSSTHDVSLWLLRESMLKISPAVAA